MNTKAMYTSQMSRLSSSGPSKELGRRMKTFQCTEKFWRCKFANCKHACLGGQDHEEERSRKVCLLAMKLLINQVQ